MVGRYRMVLTIEDAAGPVKLAQKTIDVTAIAGGLPALKIRGKRQIQRAEFAGWTNKPRGGGDDDT